MRRVQVTLGTVELAIDLGEDIAAAVSPDGPGGRRVTWREAMGIGLSVAMALVRMRGTRGDVAHLEDAIERIGLRS